MIVWHVVFSIIQSLIVIIFVLISVAYLTLGERKVMASIQGRRGPNDVGYLGLLQALADGLKLFCKETIIPLGINKYLFFFAPWFAFILSIMGWAVIPFGEGIAVCNTSLGILYTLVVSTMGLYGILLAGWASNSSYAFFGASRSVAQMISFDISVGFVVLTVALCAGSLDLAAIVKAQSSVWYCIPLFPVFLIFLVASLVETNRHPFDLVEGESELVGGFNVEYTGMPFALFFLAEYSNMLLMSALTSVLFFGGWLSPIPDFFLPEILQNCYLSGAVWFSLKISLVAAWFAAVRAALPRFRYDQLMTLAWKSFLPLSIAFVIITASILMSFNILVVA